MKLDLTIPTRRNFLAMSLAGATAAFAQKPKQRFPTAARERLAVSTYPFRKRIASSRDHDDGESPRSGGMTLAEFAKTVEPKLGVPGIEPWSPHFQSTDEEYVRSLHSAFGEAGLHVVNIPVDAKVRLCGGTAAERAEGVAVWRKWIDTAVLLESPSVRVHLPHENGNDAANCAVGVLSELAKYGSVKNVVVNLENDDPDSERPERVVQVIKTVNSPFLRALPDFCNSMIIRNDQNYNDQALRTLFPLAYNVSHVKDMEVDGAKVFRVDVGNIFAIAKKAGYKGYFSMEWEGTGDDYQGTKKLIDASLKNLS